MLAMNLDAEFDGSNDNYDDCLLQVTVAFLHLVRRSPVNIYEYIMKLIHINELLLPLVLS